MYVYYRKFEQSASGLVEELYKIDEENSHKLLSLTRELKTWKGSSVFKLADKAGLMDFMQQVCCQTKLDSIWYGKLTTRTALQQVGLHSILH